MNNLANLYKDRGQLIEAQQLLRQAVLVRLVLLNQSVSLVVLEDYWVSLSRVNSFNKVVI